MSLHFHYRLQPANHPVTPLNGRWVRPRPIIAVTLLGLLDSRAQDALLDTGSDDTVFPEDLAAVIGVDLSNVPIEMGSAIGGGIISLRYAEVTLRVTDGNEQREWRGWVGFTPAKIVYPTLGFAGVLQFFTTHFYGDREEVELEVNSLYPGT